MWLSSPHHSWMTMRPGPEPLSGTARYPWAVPPLLGNVTFWKGVLSVIGMSLSVNRSGAKCAQCRAGEPPDGPFVHRPGAERGVELDGRGVPVQDAPFQPRVAAVHADPGELGQQGLALPPAASLGFDVEVFQVDAVLAGPRRIVQEPQGEPGHAAVPGRPAGHPGRLGGHMGEHRRVRPEQGRAQVVLGRRDHVERLLVLGQVADEAVDDRHITGMGGPDHAVKISFAEPGRAGGRTPTSYATV